jgi:hypothetical protein
VCSSWSIHRVAIQSFYQRCAPLPPVCQKNLCTQAFRRISLYTIMKAHNDFWVMECGKRGSWTKTSHISTWIHWVSWWIKQLCLRLSTKLFVFNPREEIFRNLAIPWDSSRDLRGKPLFFPIIMSNTNFNHQISSITTNTSIEIKDKMFMFSAANFSS